MTEAGISPGLSGDLYVSLGEPLDGQAWSVRVSFKAWVRFVWLGALLMAGGGLLALRDRRYQSATSSAASDAALAQG
jgi:cytochrome c-type biogenesis protein CcmF